MASKIKDISLPLTCSCLKTKPLRHNCSYPVGKNSLGFHALALLVQLHPVPIRKDANRYVKGSTANGKPSQIIKLKYL